MYASVKWFTNSIVCKYFDKNSATLKETGINSENEQLAKELHQLLDSLKSIRHNLL